MLDIYAKHGAPWRPRLRHIPHNCNVHASTPGRGTCVACPTLLSLSHYISVKYRQKPEKIKKTYVEMLPASQNPGLQPDLNALFATLFSTFYLTLPINECPFCSLCC